MQSESQLTATLCKQIKSAGGMIHPIVAGTLGQSGWPDRLIIHPQFFGYIEFKRESNHLTKIQNYIHKELNRRVPHSAFVCRFIAGAGTNVIIDIEYLGVRFASCMFDGVELLNTLNTLSTLSKN